LSDNAEIFFTCGDILESREALMLSFCLKKYYIILLRKYKGGLYNLEYLNSKWPHARWGDYVRSPDFDKRAKAA
jgi:hypothetical protein